MPSLTITDQPSAIVPPARRRWIRISNVGSHQAFLLVDNPNVTAEDGPNAGLPLKPNQNLTLSGTILNSYKAPFTVFAVTASGQTTSLRLEDYNPAIEPVVGGSMLFNGFPISYNGATVSS
jgi:hypothetical protein